MSIFSSPLAEQVALLQEVLGQRLTAVGLGLSDPREIGRLASGASSSEDSELLRRVDALTDAVVRLRGYQSDQSIRAWAVGAAPELNHEAPIERLAAGDTEGLKLSASHWLAFG